MARETADFLLRELRTAEGGFASALDADSEGVEGRFYAWTPAQLVEVLGPDDGAVGGRALLEVTAGRHLRARQLDAPAARTTPTTRSGWAACGRRCSRRERPRVRPARDDKVVAAWNGLAISGLVAAGRAPGRAGLRRRGRGAPAACSSTCTSCDGRLRRVSRDGVVGRHAGVLEDHGCLARACSTWPPPPLDAAWLDHAGVLLDVALARFRAEDGGFFDTASDAEALVARPRDPSDNAYPRGLSARCTPCSPTPR